MDTAAGKSADLTLLLQRVAAGDRSAEDALVSLVFDKLKRLAAAALRGERPGHTLQTTALVNEAYLRLIDRREVPWENRAHFFRVAATVMRNILVDHARRRTARKRGGLAVKVSFNEELLVSEEQSNMVLAVDSALKRLEQLDVRQAKVVEMRFFSGLKEEEIASALGVSSRTVKRDWVLAKAWLYGELNT